MSLGFSQFKAINEHIFIENFHQINHIIRIPNSLHFQELTFIFTMKNQCPAIF